MRRDRCSPVAVGSERTIRAMDGVSKPSDGGDVMCMAYGGRGLAESGVSSRTKGTMARMDEEWMFRRAVRQGGGSVVELREVP